MTEANKVIEQIQRLGTVTVVPNTLPGVELTRVANFIMTAKDAGHAITVDETFDADGKNSGRVVRVYHYLTCATCMREAQDD